MKGRNNLRKIGKEMEDLAVSFLLNQNCQILDRNFTIRGGEIDIIARQNNTIVFVEVKYRENMRYGGPQYAIQWQKQLRIARTALFYIAKKNIPLECSFRFDAILICNRNEISWIQNAFDFPKALEF